jgi:hypothetical protein
MGAANTVAKYSASELVASWKTSLGDDPHPAPIASKRQTTENHFSI